MIKVARDIRKYNLKRNRAIKIVIAILFWFAVFLLINLIAKRNQANGAVANITETYVVLAVSTIISLLGVVTTLYGILYLERFSIKRRKKRRKPKGHNL